MSKRLLNLTDVRLRLAAGESYRTVAKAYGVEHHTVARYVERHAPDLVRPREPLMAPASFTPLKLLVLDIETSPNLAYVWGVWQQNIAPSQIVEQKSTLCFAAKWLGDDDVTYHSTFHDGREEMVLAAWRLLNAADGVIGYNSKRFDVKHLNTEFLLAGLTPPSPFQHIDLLQTARREFEFGSRKLEAVADRLGLGAKVEHEGFALWEKVIRGDAEAWERMRAYNMQDVHLTEQLYYRFLPWITNHPSYAAHSGELVCTNCGSDALERNGYRYTKTGRYQRYHCDACGKWTRGRRRETMTETTETSSW